MEEKSGDLQISGFWISFRAHGSWGFLSKVQELWTDFALSADATEKSCRSRLAVTSGWYAAHILLLPKLERELCKGLAVSLAPSPLISVTWPLLSSWERGGEKQRKEERHQQQSDRWRFRGLGACVLYWLFRQLIKTISVVVTERLWQELAWVTDKRIQKMLGQIFAAF